MAHIETPLDLFVASTEATSNVWYPKMLRPLSQGEEPVHRGFLFSHNQGQKIPTHLGLRSRETLNMMITLL